METNNPTTEKAIQFVIAQDEFKLSFSLTGAKEQFNKSNPKLADNIVKQITGRLYSLMLIRKQSGQKLGLNFSKEFNFSFMISGQVINTLKVQEELNIKLKLGYKAERRKSFENVLTLIINEIVRGSKLYTETEVKALAEKLNGMENTVKAAKKIIKEAATPKEVQKTA